MIKQSVKKPFTVLVAVLVALILAVVSLSKMTTDLLPEISTPYLVVVTTYPGASPEKVELEVTEPMERALGTVTGVKNITSSSAENYCMVMLEFQDDTDMDAALVKVNTAIDTVENNLPELCSTPSIMEISMDMMATMYLSVSREDMDVYDLTDYVSNTLIPQFQRQDGVANVSALGLVEHMVEIRLDKDKVDELNDRLAATVAEKLDEAKEQLDEAQAQIDDGLAKLESGEKELQASQSQTADELGELSRQMNEALATQSAYTAILTSQQANRTALQTELDAYASAGVVEQYEQMNTMLSQMSAFPNMPSDVADAIAHPEKLEALRQMLTNMGQAEAAEALTVENLQQMHTVVTQRIPQIELELTSLDVEIMASQAILDSVSQALQTALDNYAAVEAGKISAAAALGAAQAQIQSGKTALEDAQAELDKAAEDFSAARDAALKNANLDQLANMDTLSSLIYAQNFSMPAGYIEDKDAQQWLIKVGEAFTTPDELESMLLTHIDGLGDVTLGDVATVTLIDNASDSYSRMNGKSAVLLSIYKNSTSGTSAVSKTCKAAIEELTAREPDLHISVLMDQGDYIAIFVKSIVSNIIIGAALAILVLAIFLRSVRPTLVVAFSIPFSVLVAILIMYFTGITLNIMSMAGLALGIGMLVDNSIVVIENIYRLRGRGVAAPRASVQGAKQVAGAIISSTLTTVCVFLPIIFTSGMVRQLMLPFALTISFALLASLVVALTVVPCLGSVALRRDEPRHIKFFETLKERYGKALALCLKRKWIPIGTSLVLLAFSIVMVARMGLVVIPAMGSNQIYVQVTMDETLEMDECYTKADEIGDVLLSVDGVDEVGVMTNTANLISAGLNVGGNDYFNYTYYLILSGEIDTVKELEQTHTRLEQALAGQENCTVTVASSDAGDLAAFTSSGLSITLSGHHLDTLRTIARDVAALVEQVDGFTDVSDGQEEADEVIHLVIDRSAAMAKGLTVAQIYMEISQRLTTQTTAASLTMDGKDVDVVVADETDLLTVENLLELPFETTVTDAQGNQTPETHTLGEFARVEYTPGLVAINRANGTHTMTVTAATAEGYNTTRLSEQVQALLDGYDMPSGYTAKIGGEVEQVYDMLEQMALLMLLGFLLVYLVMVAQFQSLLSPFIILFTIPLAFTGGLIGLLLFREQLSMVSLLGFTVLMGTVVNNGIVFVDYVNQLRLGGLGKRDALIAAGKTRMRPILMTALTTILSMSTMMFSRDITAGMSRGMAVVVGCGLLYATFMTLFVVPVVYDILYRKQPTVVDVGDDLDDEPDDAAEYLQQMQ